MGLICPYCDAEISERAIEAEDGCCPECGAVITALDDLGEEGFENEEDFGDEDEDDGVFVRERGRDPFKDAFKDLDDDN